MLFLRRCAGQSITFIQNRKILGKITFLRVDPRTDQIDIEEARDRSSVQHTLSSGAKIRVLEDLLTFKFSFILEYDRYLPAANVGLEAPQSIAIYRSERLIGLGPDQIAALHRG